MSERPEPPAPEIAPRELVERLQRGESLLVIDVREPFEREICGIAGTPLVPLAELPGRVDELRAHAEVILYCHHGVRSLEAAHYLRAQGIAGARSLAGGIDRWSREIDPRVPRY